jgi:hypothetical protein
MAAQPTRTRARTTLRSTWVVTICAASVFSQFWMSPRAAAQQASQLEFIEQPGQVFTVEPMVYEHIESQGGEV